MRLDAATSTATTLWRKKWFIFPPVILLLWVMVDTITEMMPGVHFSKMLLTEHLKPSLLGGSNQTSVGPLSRSECEVAYGRRRFFTKEEERDPPLLFSFPGQSLPLSILPRGAAYSGSISTHLALPLSPHSYDSYA